MSNDGEWFVTNVTELGSGEYECDNYFCMKTPYDSDMNIIYFENPVWCDNGLFSPSAAVIEVI